MELFKPKDLLKINPKLNFIGGEHFARLLMLLLRFDRLNKIYSRIGDRSGRDFVDGLIELLKINFKYDDEELKKRIPQTGPVIVVCNYPFGGLESILLIHILSQVRSDIKIVSTQLLQKVEAIREYFFENMSSTGKHEGIWSNEGPAAHLRLGGILCIFPAGVVSQFDHTHVLSDKQWDYSTIKFIKNQKVPVVPVHFDGNNSKLFYLMSKLHQSLIDLKLPTEMLHYHKKPIKIRIGNPISVEYQDSFSDIYQYGRYLRAKTYLLSSKIDVRKFFNYKLKRQRRIEQIAAPVDAQIIRTEINDLSAEFLLFKLKNYMVYCAPSKRIPNVLMEIGRLREMTFRDIGEGTNRSNDLDEFDLYYHQMFIWDVDNQQIVGAYRIGKGAEIMHKYGIRGFYIQSLFRIKDDLFPLLSQTMELGRSFIVKEYQRKPMPLFLLWKGILYFTLKNPEYRYLIGPVSISDVYSRTSKEMIIKFIMTHHFDWKLAKYINPRKAFKFKKQDSNLNVIIQTIDEDINSLDKFIGDVDEINSGLPVLLKKYIKLNAKIIGFNVDPNFNNCLDGLILLDLFNIPAGTIESLSKEANDGEILKQYYSNLERNEVKKSLISSK